MILSIHIAPIFLYINRRVSLFRIMIVLLIKPVSEKCLYAKLYCFCLLVLLFETCLYHVIYAKYSGGEQCRKSEHTKCLLDCHGLPHRSIPNNSLYAAFVAA